MFSAVSSAWRIGQSVLIKLKKLLISGLEKYEIHEYLPDFVKGALVCIILNAKTSFMPKDEKQRNKNLTYLISAGYTIMGFLAISKMKVND